MAVLLLAACYESDMGMRPLCLPSLRRFVEGNPDLTLGPEFDHFSEQNHQDLAAAMDALDSSLRSISA